MKVFSKGLPVKDEIKPNKECITPTDGDNDDGDADGVKRCQINQCHRYALYASFSGWNVVIRVDVNIVKTQYYTFHICMIWQYFAPHSIYSKKFLYKYLKKIEFIDIIKWMCVLNFNTYKSVKNMKIVWCTISSLQTWAMAPLTLTKMVGFVIIYVYWILTNGFEFW